MAQRTEKEETEFKSVPETLTLCINNCGVVGNPATNNMCQKCFNATTTSSSTTSSQRTRRSGSLRSPTRSTPDVTVDLILDRTVEMVDEESKEKTTTAKAKVVSRCSGCRKRVGLTGFRCRCGDLFCAVHRYSDRHDCSYDYKSAGREVISRENPVVKAAKIVRI